MTPEQLVELAAGGESESATLGQPSTARFYDRNVKLLLAAAAPIDALYRGERLRAEFERTKSRLTEMQSPAS